MNAGGNLLVPALVAGRICLSFVNLPELLQHNQQLASPLTSYHHLQEGVYLFNHSVDPYSGGSFYHSPFYLALFSTVIPSGKLASAALWTASDLIGAWALVRIWRARQRVRSSERDGLVAALYLANPYLLLPSLALSTSSLQNTFTLFALAAASEGNTSLSLLLFAFLTHLSLSSILLVPPILLLLITGPPVSRLASPRPLQVSLKKALPLAGEFAFYVLALAGVCTLVSGGWGWAGKTWGAELTLPDLTPNPGLWWYFFTEMFDHFRPFFLMVFSVHLLIYVVPLCIKFQHDPLYASFLLVGVLGTFKAYPSLADPGLFLSMIALFPETYPYLRTPIVTALLHLHSALLLPLFNHLWLAQGTGNANFFYASTLVLGVSNGFALVDAAYAGLRVAIGEKEGWQVVQE